MNPIVDKINNFIKEFDEIEKLNADAHKRLSEVDIELSKYYHKIEGINITHISQSHRLIKELKIILEKRRHIKLETIVLRSTCDQLRDRIDAVKGSHKKTLIKDSEIRAEIKTRANE